MNNNQIAETLDQIADLLEFTAANPFRIRAYRKGARVLRDLTESVASIVADPMGDLTGLDGIGKDLAAKLVSLVETGRVDMLDELLTKVPESVLALMRIPGLGPKKAAVLYNELGIATLDQLRTACEAGNVRDLKGFAAKTEEKILANLEFAEKAGQRMLWAKADEIAQRLLTHMGDCPSIQQMEMAGSYRRGRETVGDLDLLVESDDANQQSVNAVMDRFGAFDDVTSMIARGETKMSVRLFSGLQIDLRVVRGESFGAALQYFTGSKDHNVVLRGLAKKQGLKINEYGVFRGDESIAGRTEQEVYATLGLPAFAPEIREARREFDWAEQGSLPALIETSDIQGDLHMHTTATDGRGTLGEMIAAARVRGLKYIAITDHSKRVSMAGGLDERRVIEQWSEIDRLGDQSEDITILKGIECDILERGGMDLPDEVLAQADWVVAAIHYGQNQSRQQITDRILGALENPHVSAIAHPTGRLISRRKAYEVDIEVVFQAARENHKLLELNANPMRLDLDDIHCAAAKRHGVAIVISTDAHSIDGLDVLRYGILQARRAGLTKDDVANTRSWPEIMRLLGK